LAVKIVRQPNKIALMGAPTSAAAHGPGHERAPAALRAAGLVEKLQSAGYEVTDLGDIETYAYQPDEEYPRARNVGAVVAALNALKPRVEQAVKSGALLLILSGDCIVALATVAGIRRYYRGASLIYLDRDADVNIPATSPSGCVDGMVIAHAIGRGAPELVRFWNQPPLVREPEIALFGIDRLDPPEREVLNTSPILRYFAADILRDGAAASAHAALERSHALAQPYVVHFDTDVISSDDYSATNLPAAGGLRLEHVREALEAFVSGEHLTAFEVTTYNPDKDPDGSAARMLVDLIVSALAARLAKLTAAAAEDEAKPAEEAGPAEETVASPAEAESKPQAEEVAAPALAAEAAPAAADAPEASPADETPAEPASEETPAESAADEKPATEPS